jgi:hypothetical protein
MRSVVEEKSLLRLRRGQVIVQLAQPADMLESSDAHLHVAICVIHARRLSMQHYRRG